MTRGLNLVFKSMSDVKYKFLSELCHRHLLSKFHQANISIKDCQDFSNSLRASNLERKSWKHESLLRYVNLSYDLFILCTQTARIFNALHSHTMLRCGQGDIETLGDTERVRHRVIVTRDGATQQSSLLLSLLTLIMPPPRGLHQTSDAWYWPDTKCGHTGPGCQGRIRVTPKPARSEQRIMILKLLNLLTTSSTHSQSWSTLKPMAASKQSTQWNNQTILCHVNWNNAEQMMLRADCDPQAGSVSGPGVTREQGGPRVIRSRQDTGIKVGAPGHIGWCQQPPMMGSCQQIKRDSPHIWGRKHALASFVFQCEVRVIVTRERRVPSSSVK